MGYQIPDRDIVLEGFEGDFAGLEVRCTKNVSMSKYLELESLDDGEHLSELFQLFGDDFLRGWNLEEDGEAVPADGEGLKRQPPDLVNILIREWRMAVADVTVPLEKPSTDGGMMEATEPPIDLGSMSTPNS